MSELYLYRASLSKAKDIPFGKNEAPYMCRRHVCGAFFASTCRVHTRCKGLADYSFKTNSF